MRVSVRRFVFRIWALIALADATVRWLFFYEVALSSNILSALSVCVFVLFLKQNDSLDLIDFARPELMDVGL